MARPKDYGDQFPSDTSDPTPKSPTADFEEADPEITLSADRRPVDLDIRYDFTDQEADSNFIEDNPRHIYYGHILSETTSPTQYPRQFEVLLTSGETVTAESLDMLDSDVVDIGANCLVVAGLSQDVWYLFVQYVKRGVQQNNVYASLYTSSASIGTGSSREKITVDTLLDANGMNYSLSANRIIVVEPGYYWIETTGDGTNSGFASMQASIRLWKNATDITGGIRSYIQFECVNGCWAHGLPVHCNANDYIEVAAQQHPSNSQTLSNPVLTAKLLKAD